MQKNRIRNNLDLYSSFFSKLKWRENFVPIYFALSKDKLEGCYSQLEQDFQIKIFHSNNDSRVNFFINVGAHDGLMILRLITDKFFQKKSFFRRFVGKFLNRFKLP
jgi:hypothetical protein